MFYKTRRSPARAAPRFGCLDEERASLPAASAENVVIKQSGGAEESETKCASKANGLLQLLINRVEEERWTAGASSQRKEPMSRSMKAPASMLKGEESKACELWCILWWWRRLDLLEKLLSHSGQAKGFSLV